MNLVEFQASRDQGRPEESAASQDIVWELDALRLDDPKGFAGEPVLGPQQASARLAGARGDVAAAEDSFTAAIQRFREGRDPFQLAQPLAELAEILLAQGRSADAEPFLAEAQEMFERLGARPWLQRIERIRKEMLPVASSV